MVSDDLDVRVLVMQREEYIAAVAIDMDLWGYGESREEAISNLEDHLRMQVKYLTKTHKVELLIRPAPGEYQDMYQECYLSYVKNTPVPGWWIDRLSIQIDKFSYQKLAPRRQMPSPALRYQSVVCHSKAA